MASSARNSVLYDRRSLKDFCISQLWEEFDNSQPLKTYLSPRLEQRHNYTALCSTTAGDFWASSILGCCTGPLVDWVVRVVCIL